MSVGRPAGCFYMLRNWGPVRVCGHSLEGHSLISLGGLESQAACNRSQSAGLERGRQRAASLSCLFPSLLLFYQHFSERRSALAYPTIHHSCSSRLVLYFFSILDPAKTKNTKTNIKEERERQTNLQKQRRCAISETVFRPFIRI